MSRVCSSFCANRFMRFLLLSMVTFWGHTEMSPDYRHEHRCSLKLVFLFSRIVEVALHSLPFCCVMTYTKQRMRMSHHCHINLISCTPVLSQPNGLCVCVIRRDKCSTLNDWKEFFFGLTTCRCNCSLLLPVYFWS